jgi:hypothetical protein
VHKVYSDSNTTAVVTITLTCPAGTTVSPPGTSNVGTKSLTGGGDAVFTVTGYAPGASCSATESGVPAGYTSNSPCSGTIATAPSGSGSCTITNTLNSASFTVHKVYSDSNTTAVVTITLTCPAGTTVSPPGTSNVGTKSLTGGGDAVFTVTGYAPGASCSATESGVPAGYTSNSPCSGTIATAPSGTGSCTITNTATAATEIPCNGQDDNGDGLIDENNLEIGNFQQPINDQTGTMSAFKRGSTVPVKFTMYWHCGTAFIPVTNAQGQLLADRGLVRLYIAVGTIADVCGIEIEISSSTPSDTGNIFRYDGSGQFHYNWGTKSYGANTYTIQAAVYEDSAKANSGLAAGRIDQHGVTLMLVK